MVKNYSNLNTTLSSPTINLLWNGEYSFKSNIAFTYHTILSLVFKPQHHSLHSMPPPVTWMVSMTPVLVKIPIQCMSSSYVEEIFFAMEERNGTWCSQTSRKWRLYVTFHFSVWLSYTLSQLKIWIQIPFLYEFIYLHHKKFFLIKPQCLTLFTLCKRHSQGWFVHHQCWSEFWYYMGSS